MLKITNSERAPKAIGPYSQGVILNNFLFLSGQIPINPKTGEIQGQDVTEQAKQVMENIKAVLEASDSGYAKVIKTTCFLHDMKDFESFNKVYEKYFVSKPARSCVAVKGLPKNVLCEVEAIAYIN